MQWGRLNRASYFLAFAIVVIGYAGLTALLPGRVHFAEILLAIVAIPRLHDIGRQARWWVVGVIVFEIALVFGAGYFLPLTQVLMIAGAFVLLLLAAMLWLGAIKGDAGANAYGEPPPAGLSFPTLPRKPAA